MFFFVILLMSNIDTFAVSQMRHVNYKKRRGMSRFKLSIVDTIIKLHFNVAK